MLTYLKNKPFVGLALAIASGYVLAHVITKSGDYLFTYDPELLGELALGALAAAVVAFAINKRRPVARWIGAHKIGLSIGFSMLFFPCLAGAYAVMHGAPNGLHAIWVTFIRLGVFFFLVNWVGDIHERRRNKRSGSSIDAPDAALQPPHPTH